VGTLLWIGAARAEPSAAERETARNLVYEGRRLRQEGKVRDAVEKFRAAHAIMKVPTTGIEVAQALVDLGLYVEARDAMLEVSRMPATPGEPLPFAQAREEAREAVNDLAARTPSVTFAVSGAAAPTVLLDGTRLDPSTLALPRRVNPGEHVAVASAPGRSEARATFALHERESLNVPLALGPPAIDAPAPRVTREEPVHVTGGGTSPLVYVGFGTAVVGVVVGSIAGIVSATKTSSIKARCPNDACGPDTHSELVQARTTAIVADVAFGVAILGAGLGVVGLLVGRPRDAHASGAASIRLVAGPGTAALGGCF
jgi:hypothetical protein